MSHLEADGASLELTDAEGGRGVAYLYLSEGQLIINAQEGANLVVVKTGPDAAALLKKFASRL